MFTITSEFHATFLCFYVGNFHPLLPLKEFPAFLVCQIYRWWTPHLLFVYLFARSFTILHFWRIILLDVELFFNSFFCQYFDMSSHYIPAWKVSVSNIMEFILYITSLLYTCSLQNALTLDNLIIMWRLCVALFKFILFAPYWFGCPFSL